MNYWEECITEAFEESGIVATPEQIDSVASWVEGAYENYGMAHGHDAIPNPLATENDRLTRKLERENRKVHCEACSGRGRITSYGPCHSSESECHVCRGEGRYLP